MTDTPYDVGKWLAEQLHKGHDRISDGEVLLWAGRAAQPIAKVEIDEGVGENGALVFHFDDVGKLQIVNGSNSCCESRYLSCDDDLPSFTGARILQIDLDAGGPAYSEEGEFGDCHEKQFLKFRTTKGDFTVVSHNEHNGYYGGIDVDLTWVDA